MATTTQHINARNDPDLLDRFIAAAEQQGFENASTWIQARMGKLVTQEVDGSQTISDVHAYAENVRKEYIENTPQRPGADLGAVTDAHLVAAIGAVQTSEAAL